MNASSEGRAVLSRLPSRPMGIIITSPARGCSPLGTHSGEKSGGCLALNVHTCACVHISLGFVLGLRTIAGKRRVSVEISSPGTPWSAFGWYYGHSGGS